MNASKWELFAVISVSARAAQIVKKALLTIVIVTKRKEESNPIEISDEFCLIFLRDYQIGND